MSAVTLETNTEADGVTAGTGSGEKVKRGMRRDAHRGCQQQDGKNEQPVFFANLVLSQRIEEKRTKEEWKRTNDAASTDSSQEHMKLKPLHIWIWMEFSFFRGRTGFRLLLSRREHDKGGGGFLDGGLVSKPVCCNPFQKAFS